ncbi:hypothetical protein NA78x_004019 [Anatilimnocola sp. NA78]|uniref:hypothetical protein n=1 Tax=Anatilimnocola sp. NA78 TaxID=3415683 RepID=UPI003CE56BEC
MASSALRSNVLDFLSTRTVKHGESVEYGWFIFQAIVENGQLDLETLDFLAMASFTRDFGPVERIDAEQSAVLAKQRVEPERCALWHAALISRSYMPGSPRAFMERLDQLEGNKSGWFVGVADDPLDVNEPANLHFQSLYELTIHDARFAPYWLLPVGFHVEFDGNRPAITSRCT